jgi:hypothetical protein
MEEEEHNQDNRTKAHNDPNRPSPAFDRCDEPANYGAKYLLKLELD